MIKRQSRHAHLTLRTLACVLAVCLCAAATSVFSADKDKPHRSAADLRYGTALYAYYQQDYFDALAELMVAKHRGGIKNHGDNPDIMAGAMQLAYGMTHSASDRFTQLLQENRSLEVRDAAWFYLSKILYDQGDYAAADSHLQRISEGKKNSINAERHALQVAVDVRMDRLQLAQQRLAAQKQSGLDEAFQYYNLGSAYARNGDFNSAEQFYRQAIDLVVANNKGDEVYLSLYDKANTAAGYGQLYQQDYSRAIDYFSQVRLDSQFSRQALIGFGWSATENQNFAMALTPFRQLSELSPSFAEVQEALLALPFTYEQMDQPGMALSLYQRAQELFDEEIIRIDESVAAIQTGSLLEELLDSNFVPDDRFFYLAELTSRTDFQQQLQQLGELRELQQRLQVWQQKLTVYDDLLDQRQSWRQEKIGQLSQRNLPEEIQSMRRRYHELQAEIQQIESSQSFVQLLEGDDQDLQSRVERSLNNLTVLERAGEDADEYREPLRRYRGVMLWRAAEQSTDLLWQRKRALRELDKQLTVLADNKDRVDQQILVAPDLIPYQDRLVQLSQRLTQQSADLDQSIAAVESGIEGQLIGQMHAQQQRLRRYIANVRLAIARLYDQASQSQAAAEG